MTNDITDAELEGIKKLAKACAHNSDVRGLFSEAVLHLIVWIGELQHTASVWRERTKFASAEVEKLETQVEALRVARNWHPITTAPKDGTRIWATNVAEIARHPNPDDGYAWNLWVVMWEPRFNEWCDEQTGADRDPTHWMRLPEMPKLARTAQREVKD
jgi:hypothetical protein